LLPLGKEEFMKVYPTDDTSVSYIVSESAAAYGLINFIRGGLPFQFFLGLGERLPFSIREWARILHLSERSLQRYQKDQKAFDALQSERIIEITMLSNYGKSIFGSDRRWMQWLALPNLAMGGLAPQSLLDSSIGIQLIRDELGRLEHGIVS
jgi:putative toxin-antitoxin system antitoxin component (TIGR02293 family)